ncbi:SDR family NAD(P)-dependent oxidoreductase [Litorimonas sp. RW-G-Af-16]|uniref:SDR family NAD(P)-dependent oxidoreductase n=1 Tax=Litorimonas sp. RW-G-Af-16 TaxID=3241168 RepID=UPI00390C57B4
MKADKTILVTGSSRGLGASICSALQADGYHVIGASRSGKAPDGIEAIACDIGEYQSVKDNLKSVGKMKSLYGLVNAAGIASMNLAISTPPETIERIIRTNLIGTINVNAFLAKRFVRNKGGRIINFSTIAVPISLKGESIYIASKAGVEGFSKSFAREMADFNTTVNVIAPGPIETDLIAKVPAASIQRIIDQQIIPKQFTKDDIVDLTRMLLSESSHMLSGQVFNVGGA